MNSLMHLYVIDHYISAVTPPVVVPVTMPPCTKHDIDDAEHNEGNDNATQFIHRNVTLDV